MTRKYKTASIPNAQPNILSQYALYERRLARALGREIHRTRATRRIDLKCLARKTGFSEKRLDQYELGKNQMRLADLIRIAYVIGKTPHDLIAKACDDIQPLRTAHTPAQNAPSGT